MQQLSNRCNYALRAMLELAKRDGTGPVTIAVIAKSQRLPVRFLEAILRQLKEAGLVTSQRGKDGGYQLARLPGDIHMGELIRLFEGPPPPAPPEGRNSGVAPEEALFDEIMEKAEGARDAVYDSVSFYDLVERERQLQENFIENYSI